MESRRKWNGSLVKLKRQIGESETLERKIRINSKRLDMGSKENRPKVKSGKIPIAQRADAQIPGLPAGYADFLDDLKKHIRMAQAKAALSVNRELILLYWDIGRRIVVQQEHEGWGVGVIERLAKDIQLAFPGTKGFSARNIWRMKAFYLAYSKQLENLPQPVADFSDEKGAQAVQEADGLKLPQLVAEIPWGHNVVLIEKVKARTERLWYIQKTIEHGWSRNVLVHQIESGLYHRKGRAITNFEQTLPSPQSDLVQQTLKDPYLFDFLALDENIRERDLEIALVDHIREFLLELGVGFAFVGRQVPLEVGGQGFYLDLLFYHMKLRCFVVIELKTGEFKPEYAGKMNFYLSAVDDRLRHPDDEPSIGIILCKSKSRVIVEYTLRDTSKPIGVSAYQLTRSLPEEMKGSLPTIEELVAELEAVEELNDE